LAAPNIDWTNTFVPIMDSQEAIADKIALRYSRRLASAESQALIPDLIAQAEKSICRLRQQVTRARQRIDFQVRLHGNGDGRGLRNNYLY
jgi:hypothetical protein